MVCRCTTKNRLETRMDRLRTTPSNIPGQQRKKGHLHTSTKERPSREKDGSLFPRKDHLPSKTNPCRTCRRYPLQISKTQEDVQQRRITDTTQTHYFASRH